MPRSSEHKKKYLENKNIIESVLNEKNNEHCNWISTICFYAALHMVEMQLALDGIHSRDHVNRENNMESSKRISQYVLIRYKHMYTVSILARYEAASVSPAVANQMKHYLRQIEENFEKSRTT